MTTLEWAKYYVSKGFSVIPVRPKDKKPAIDTWKIFQEHMPKENQLNIWFGNGSDKNIAILTGGLSGIAVIDLDRQEAVKFAKDNNFPETPLVKTGKGYHLYYRYKEGARNFQKRDDLPGIDLRAEGGYVVAPPSIHESGNQYQWVEGKGLDDLPFADFPEIILTSTSGDKTPIRDLYQGVPEGSRNDALARLVGSWVNNGLTFQDCLENAQIWNSKNTPFLPDREIERTVQSIYEKHHREKDENGKPENHQKVIDDNEVIDPDKKIIQPIPFPFHVFPKKVINFIFRVSESFSIQPEMTASLILAILSGVIGNTLRVSVKSGYDVILFLWLMIIGRSGYGKSPVMNYLMGAIENRQAHDSATYEAALRNYRQAKEQGTDAEEPKAVHKLVSDITVEALADVFHGDQRGIIAHHDELASFMLGMDQYRAKGNDLQHYLSLFYGKSWKIDRKKRSSFIPNTGLALIGGIQSEILPRIFESTTIKNGLFPRFLTLNVEERPSKFDRNGINKEELNYWDSIISQCYEIPLQHDEQGFAEPYLLTLDSNSLDLWISFHDEYASLIPYMPDHFSPFCEKLKGYYSIKFIGLLHVIDCIDRELPFTVKIEPETVSGAIELTRYFAGQAQLTLNLYDESHRFTQFQVKLIKTLYRLQDEVKNGRILFSRIKETFNDDLPELLKHTSGKIAGIVRELKLMTEKGSHNVVYLIWEADRIKNLFSRISITSITTITQKEPEEAQNVIDVTDVIDESGNEISSDTERKDIIEVLE